MKKISLIICIIAMLLMVSCSANQHESPNESYNENYNENNDSEESLPAERLKKGDKLTISGIVEYSEEPSDIGEKYCSVTCLTEIKYSYTNIYNEESEWSSNVFFTKGEDTELLKKYVGQNVSVSGVLDTEYHGIPYITNIEILQ